jgi:hypothetical protein
MSYVAPSVTPSGTTFAQFQAGGASGHLERLIAAQGGTAAPTSAPTLAASGSGSMLAANTYYAVFTETNGFGETTPSPASLSQTVTSGQQLTVTFPALQAGNTARNAYLGLASTGPFSLYATGITASSLNCTVAAPANSFAVHPPTTSSTGLTHVDANRNTHPEPLSFIRAVERDNESFGSLYRYLRTLIDDFNRGDPMTFGGVVEKLRNAHVVFAMFNSLCSEMGTLIDANPGTLGTTATGIGNRKGNRTWP